LVGFLGEVVGNTMHVVIAADEAEFFFLGVQDGSRNDCCYND